MNKIKEIKLDNTNWIEVVFIDEDNKENHCESFGDSDEYIALFKQRCTELGVKLSNNNQKVIDEMISKRKVFTAKEITEIEVLKEAQRIKDIKSKAGEIIKSKYPVEWQLNHPRLDESYLEQYKWIDNIRRISDESELNSTSLEDINWGI